MARKGRSVTLFVNDFNQPAISLYEELGFKRIGMNRALIW
jgi:predicted GNAT family acetyltransferase